jgi:ribosomal-protein-alanine N-acetyltransferase
MSGGTQTYPMPQLLNFPDSVPVLNGELVYLRELDQSDIPAWFARATDIESADLAGDPVPDSIALGSQWLDRHKDRFHRHAAIRWAIVPRGSTESIGTVGLAITSEERGAANLQIVVGRAYWNKGIGTSAAQLVKSYAFDSLGLVELNAEVLQRNLASVRLLEKVGFHLLRAVPGDPQSGSDTQDCFIYVLPRPSRSAA